MRWIARILAAAADAMMLFGDVGQRQELGERARQRNRRVERKFAQPIGQLMKREFVVGVRALGERAHLFDQGVERFAFAAA